MAKNSNKPFVLPPPAYRYAEGDGFLLRRPVPGYGKEIWHPGGPWKEYTGTSWGYSTLMTEDEARKEFPGSVPPSEHTVAAPDEGSVTTKPIKSPNVPPPPVTYPRYYERDGAFLLRQDTNFVFLIWDAETKTWDPFDGSIGGMSSPTTVEEARKWFPGSVPPAART
jgi:hypothetical protein